LEVGGFCNLYKSCKDIDVGGNEHKNTQTGLRAFLFFKFLFGYLPPSKENSKRHRCENRNHQEALEKICMKTYIIVVQNKQYCLNKTI
jgi:hypothetical protein